MTKNVVDNKIRICGSFPISKEKYNVILSSSQNNSQEGKIPPGTLGILEGPIAEYDTPNLNGVSFPKRMWENTINSESFQRRFKKKAIMGWLGHPSEKNPDPKDVCIALVDIQIRPGNIVWGKFWILDTPVGQILRNLLKAGIEIGVSERGTGVVKSGGSVGTVDENSFDLEAFDAVFDPAFISAVPAALVAGKDKELQKAFSQLESSVIDNIKEITTKETLKILSEILPENSKSQNATLEKLKTDEPSKAVEVESIDSDTAELEDYIKLSEERLVIAADYTGRILKTKDEEFLKLKMQYNKLESEHRHFKEEAEKQICSAQNKAYKELQDTKKQISSAKNKITKLQSELSSVTLTNSKVVSKKDGEIETLRQKIGKLNSEVRHLHENCSVGETNLKNLQKNKLALENRLNSALEEVGQLQNAQKILSDNLRSFQSAYYRHLCKVSGIPYSEDSFTITSSVKAVEDRCKSQVRSSVKQQYLDTVDFTAFQRAAQEQLQILDTQEDDDSFSLTPFGVM